MSGHVVLFEDAGWRRLYPITLSRPAFDCRVGATSLGHRLIAQLALKDIRRVDLLCRSGLRPLVERDYPGHSVNKTVTGDVYFLNGRLLALGEGLDALFALMDKAVAVMSHGELVAARISADASAAFFEELESHLEKGLPPPTPSDHTTAPLPQSIRLVAHLWELVAANGEVIEDDFAWMDHPQLHAQPDLAQGAHLVHRDRMRIRENVRIETGAVVDASRGPVFLGEDVRIEHNAVVLGPAVIGPHSLVRGGAHIQGPVSIGPVSKVGGEIEGSIIQGYSNKQHEGYLGHAYIGSWVNLGALTTNSDLKNNYGKVRVWTPEGEVDTGQQFVGVFIGDHSKTAIGTMLNTGTVIGFSSNIAAHGFPSKHVPSFSWIGPFGTEPYDLEKALAVARAVLGRRQMRLESADEVLFRAVHADMLTLGRP
jgi:UDP-N-acetylglucosamine diphosphorylase/glucosamine-1-phosphate N-acetyltransferase